jgi:hypothetical protein
MAIPEPRNEGLSFSAIAPVAIEESASNPVVKML